MYAIPEISFEEVSGRDGNLGLVTLKRTDVLNALNASMIIALSRQLQEWEAASQIKAVIVRAAEGRAFCAGGDIRQTYAARMEQLGKNKNVSARNTEKEKPAEPSDNVLSAFFYEEYLLNRRIHHFQKPYIVLIDGIVMGGGVGISIHGSHRLATDRLLFAMPETGIGFFPDVGMLWLLERLPWHFGYYLGLTGARIGLNDCLALGLVNYAVSAEKFPDIIYALADTGLSKVADEASAAVSEVLQSFSAQGGESALFQHRKNIDACFSKKTVEDILRALEATDSAWCHEVADTMRGKSPFSLKVTLKGLQKAAKLDFDESLEMEYGLACHFLQSHDFFEGIRAAVIDRDRQPVWQPARLDQVSDRDVKNTLSRCHIRSYPGPDPPSGGVQTIFCVGSRISQALQ